MFDGNWTVEYLHCVFQVFKRNLVFPNIAHWYREHGVKPPPKMFLAPFGNDSDRHHVPDHDAKQDIDNVIFCRHTEIIT